MRVLADFRKFALRGNVIDLAVGIIIGAAFTKIVNALVTDILTPPLGLLQGGVPFREWKIPLTPGPVRPVGGEAPPVPAASGLTPVADASSNSPDPEVASILIGHFLQTVVDFLLIAIAVFLLVRFLRKAQDIFDRKQAEEAKVAEALDPPEDVLLLREIRDMLKAQKQG
ncbi:MAG TPA: large conductance mechanosensitive channel protein MscL [Pirellulaceae bacterium]|jgi:large conductance mechanosensitive channel|nr:large conductance mechanosensitive channel protein MscL [Pirellulaceae bacterium]